MLEILDGQKIRHLVIRTDPRIKAAEDAQHHAFIQKDGDPPLIDIKDVSTLMVQVTTETISRTMGRRQLAVFFTVLPLLNNRIGKRVQKILVIKGIIKGAVQPRITIMITT